jgi:hypothetical protein
MSNMTYRISTIAVCSFALWLLPFKVVRDVSLSFRLG